MSRSCCRDGAGIDGLRVEQALLSQADDGEHAIFRRSRGRRAHRDASRAAHRVTRLRSGSPALKLGATVSRAGQDRMARRSRQRRRCRCGRGQSGGRSTCWVRSQSTSAARKGRPAQPSKLSLSAAIGRSTFAIDRKNYLEGEIDLAASIDGRREQGADREPDDPARPLELCAVRPGRAKAGRRRWPAAGLPLRAGQRQFGVGARRLDGAGADFCGARRRRPSIRPPSICRCPASTSAPAAASCWPKLRSISCRASRPASTLAATVPEMSVSHLKQLWPFTAGRRGAALGDGQPVRRPGHQRPRAIPRAARPHRQWRPAVRRRGVWPYRHRRYALRHHRADPADARRRRLDRLPRQRRRRRASAPAPPICPTAAASRRATACSRSATPTSPQVVGKLELDIAGDASVRSRSSPPTSRSTGWPAPA